jgi:hypothetical protein
MFKYITVNTITAVIVSALAAGLVVDWAPIVSDAKAEAVEAPFLQPASVVTAPACVAQGWPHYDPRCQFDLRAGNGEARNVRIIAVR